MNQWTEQMAALGYSPTACGDWVKPNVTGVHDLVAGPEESGSDFGWRHPYKWKAIGQGCATVGDHAPFFDDPVSAAIYLQIEDANR